MEQLSCCWAVGAMAPPQWEVEQGRKGQRWTCRDGTVTLTLGHGPMGVSGSPHRAPGLRQNTITSWGHLLPKGGVAWGETRGWDTASLGLRLSRECLVPSSRMSDILPLAVLSPGMRTAFPSLLDRGLLVCPSPTSGIRCFQFASQVWKNARELWGSGGWGTRQSPWVPRTVAAHAGSGPPMMTWQRPGSPHSASIWTCESLLLLSGLPDTPVYFTRNGADCHPQMPDFARKEGRGV